MRSCMVDRHALDALLRPGQSVATHTELRQIGMRSSTITRRISPGGPWQRALPGVVFGHRGVPTAYERRLAAQAYAGPGSLVTGLDALVEHGVATARRLTGTHVHALIDHGRHRTSHGFATITRCRDLPDPVMRRGLRCAPLTRALVDACRRLQRLDDVRELVADVVQHHHVRPTAIVAEVRRAARQRTALARVVLEEVSAGIRSVAEAQLRETFAAKGVPAPEWNKEILRHGELIASPDALWRDVWLVLELDSVQWHLSPAAYRRTQERQRRLVLADIEVIPVSPAEVLEDPAAICRDVLTKLSTMVPRELCGLTVRDRALS